MIFIFDGENFLPEYADDFDARILTSSQSNSAINMSYKYSDTGLTKIRSGRYKSLNGLKDEYALVYKEFTVPSRHFTYIFNVFVMFQVFNFLNARKIR